MSTVKTTNITHGSNSGTANVVLDSSGNATINGNLSVTGTRGGGLFSSYAILQEQQSAGTHGGGNASGSWTTRTLNTEVADPDGIVTLSSNEFQVAAGSYLIRWRSPHYKAGVTQTRLYDVTNTAVRGSGSAANVGTSESAQYDSEGAVRVTPSGTTTYRIEYQSTSVKATNGLGQAGDKGETEIYTHVEIWKEA